MFIFSSVSRELTAGAVKVANHRLHLPPLDMTVKNREHSSAIQHPAKLVVTYLQADKPVSCEF